jgi:hypothetical protein
VASRTAIRARSVTTIFRFRDKPSSRGRAPSPPRREALPPHCATGAPFPARVV